MNRFEDEYADLIIAKTLNLEKSLSKCKNLQNDNLLGVSFDSLGLNLLSTDKPEHIKYAKECFIKALKLLEPIYLIKGSDGKAIDQPKIDQIKLQIKTLLMHE